MGQEYAIQLLVVNDNQRSEISLLSFQERIARYVSMIPFISDSAAFPDLCDIWATSEVRQVHVPFLRVTE